MQGSAHRLKTPSALQTIAEVTEWAEKCFLAVAAVGVLFMAVVTFYSVLARYFFGSNTAWAMDSTEMLMILLTFLPIAYLSRVKGHVTVDLINRLLRNKRQDLALSLLNDIVGLVFTFIVTWRGGVIFWQYLVRGSGTGVADIPMYPFMAAIPIGGFLFFIEFLVDFIIRVSGNENARPEAEPEVEEGI